MPNFCAMSTVPDGLAPLFARIYEGMEMTNFEAAYIRSRYLEG